MLEELVDDKQESRTAYWLGVDPSLHEKAVNKHFALLLHKEVSVVYESGPAHTIPEYGASKLTRKALEGVCASLWQSTWDAVRPLGRTPSGLLMIKHKAVLLRVIQAVADSYYTKDAVTRNIAAMREAEHHSNTTSDKEEPAELSGNDLLVETGVKTALFLVCTLLQHSWAQAAWQRQLYDQLQQQGAALPSPTINLPSQALRSILMILRSLEPLSLSNKRLLSPLALSSLQQVKDFLLAAMSPDSLADSIGKQLAAEILLHLALLDGNLLSLLTWVNACLSCLKTYTNEGAPSLSLESCHHAVTVLRTRLVTMEQSPPPPFDTSCESVSLIEFSLFLLHELSRQCQAITYTLAGSNKEHSIHDTSDVYGFGSNSSSQLTNDSDGEKLPKPTPLLHMKDAQLVVAGQYCTFLVYSDGSVKACGKGSNYRLGLGSSESQPNLTDVNTFPPSTHIRQLASSCGGTSHSMAVDSQGAVYSWGDGEYGMLGHNNTTSIKIPKLISGLCDKVVIQISCGHRHSAAVTSDYELFTWGCGDYGRLGHDSVQSFKTPKKVSAIGAVCQVGCGSGHTLALSRDNTTVWSFGAGSSGCLGHGDNNKQLKPTVIEGLQGTMCSKVCAGKEVSLILTTNRQVFSFGNCSAVGKGVASPHQYTPWLITTLANEGIVDISVGEGHCLALSQSGEVFAWGSNAMRQCGPGTTSTVTTPTRVALGSVVRVQQISAGSSHSVLWTALPTNRQATTVWYWPYCVSVNEETFEQLVTLIDQYKNLTNPSLPFTDITQQQSLLVSCLSLLHSHLNQCAPLGATSSLVCGRQVQPMRDLLLYLIDSHLPSEIDQVCSHAIETGASLLLPPVRERVTLLLSLLPEKPSTLSTISQGQRRQIDILLNGLLNDSREVSLLQVNDDDTPDHKEATYKLCSRMLLYIDAAMRAELAASSSADSYCSLVESFSRFIIIMYIHTSARSIKQPSESNLDWFTEALVNYSIPLMETITLTATNTDCPHQYVSSMQDVVLGFLVYTYPMMVLTAITQHDQLLQLARAIHSLIMLAPPGTIDQLELNELTHAPHGLEEKSEEMEGVWSKLCLLERALCRSAGHGLLCHYAAAIDNNNEAEEDAVLSYIAPESDSPTLHHLLYNGIAGSKFDQDTLQQDVLLWLSLCRTLPYQSISEEDDMLKQCSALSDYDELVSRLPITLPDSYYKQIDPFHSSSAASKSSLVPFSLLSLAVGSIDVSEAVSIYDAMMELAIMRDWNTCSDDESLPQLRQVSCAVLACLLHHTALYHSLARSNKPCHEVIDVYRAVFTVRKSLFLLRPIPDRNGETDPALMQWFDEMCAVICNYMFFIMCVVGQAVPHDDLPILPQGPTTSCSTERQSSVEYLTTPPAAKLSRLYSQPANMTTSVRAELSPDPPVFPVSTADWSLDEVKHSLSLLRWQRQRLDQLEVKGSPAKSTLRSSVTDAILGLVTPLMYRSSPEDTPTMSVLNKIDLLSMMYCNATRAERLKKLLESVTQFLQQCDELLPTAKLSYLTSCVNSSLTSNISCAPASLQHEVKQLYHSILQHILAPLSSTAVPSSDSYHSHLLAILWLATTHHGPADLKLVLNTPNLYHQLAVCTGDTNTALLPAIFQGEDKLATVLKRASKLAIRAIALQTSLNSEVLTTPIKYLYGFLEGYLRGSCDSEDQLGDYLGFLSALVSSTPDVFTVTSSVTCDEWCDLLLQCVNSVSSLRPRLLAVEVLGAVCQQAPCNEQQLMDALLKLLYRSTFITPANSLTQLVTQPTANLTRTIKHFPFEFDANHCCNCSTTVGYYSNDCCVQPVTSAEGDGVGYALSKITMDCGSYSWKVTRGSFDCPPFWVGVAVKPLMADSSNVTSSDQVWLLEGLSGQLYHGGMVEHGDEGVFPTVNPRDTITVLYDGDEGIISFAINDNDPQAAFTNVRSTKPLCAVIIFNRPTVPSNVEDIKFFFESLTSTRPLPASMAGLNEEAAMSGYPFLSPSSMAVSHAVCDLIYQLQDQDKWKALILDTIAARMKEMGRRIDQFLLALTDHKDDITPSLTTLITWLCEWVWPCLAVLGGVNSGFCVGGECVLETDGEGVVCVIVTTPNSSGEVEVQELNSSNTDPRSVALSDLKLADPRVLSVDRSYITPSLLTSLAHLASLHDHPHNLATILASLHDTVTPSSQTLLSSYPYLHYCEQLMRLAAVRSLHTVLHECSDTLLHALSLDDLASGAAIHDVSIDLATTLVDTMKCLVTRSIQPSVLGPVLSKAELAHVSDVVGYEHLLRIVDVRDQETHGDGDAIIKDWSYSMLQQAKDTSPSHTAAAALTPPRNVSSSESSLSPLPAAAAAPDAAVENMLLDMGFMHTVVNAAIQRCEMPDGVESRERVDLLITWILEHPDAVYDASQQPVEEETDQEMAVNELLTILGEGYFDDTPEEAIIDHAPDLLDGPNITDEVPDPLSAGDVTRSLQASLVAALGLTQPEPQFQLHNFIATDPMGASIASPHEEKKDRSQQAGLSTSCQSVVDQATHLRTVVECRSAQDRLISASVTLSARHLVLHVMESLSRDVMYHALATIGLDSVSKLVCLLRLVYGGRVPGASSSHEDNIMGAIAAMIGQDKPTGLVETCCKDLVTIAVGGVKLLMNQRKKRKQQPTDLSMLSSPEIGITQRLVETVINSNMADPSSLADALSACVLSVTIKPQCLQLWALNQLLKIFASRQTLVKDTVPNSISAQPLSGHKAQVMSCIVSSDDNTLLTISDDACIFLWGQQDDGTTSDPVSLTIPPASSEGELPILPILELNSDCSMVAAGRGCEVYVWHLTNPSEAICTSVTDIVSCLQWQRGRKNALLVGMLGGGVVRLLVDEQAVEDEFSNEPREGAVKIIETSHNGNQLVIATSSHLLLCTKNGRLVHHINEQLVDMMEWSPNDSVLAAQLNSTNGAAAGVLKLYDNGLDELPHQFSETVTTITWHPMVGPGGTCLLAGGCSDGTTHLWTISPSAMVEHTAILSTSRHGGVTRLCFSASLLAVGYSDGCVAVWNIKERDVVRESTAVSSLGGVVSMCWTSNGLVYCCLNSTTPYLLTPGIEGYCSVIFTQRSLAGLGVSDPASAPCLHALMDNLPKILQQQLDYENYEVCIGNQLGHSEYLQLLTALVHGLKLDSILTFSPLIPIHLPPVLSHDWQWLNTFTATVKMAECLIERSPFPWTPLVHHIDPSDKHHPLNNSVWTVKMDTAILQWADQKPSDWRPGGEATVYTWGDGKYKQLGHSRSENSIMSPDDGWNNAQTVVAGCCCTYVINYDGSLQSAGRANYCYDNTRSHELVTASILSGVKVVQVVAGPRFSGFGSGYGLALSSTGQVYSWGKGVHGRLGHPSPSEDCVVPKIVERLAGKDIVLLACCDDHCAALSSDGVVYTFGSTEHSKTARPSEGIDRNMVAKITRYLSDDRQELNNVKIGYVACGQHFTAAIDQRGERVFMCGKLGSVTHVTMTHLSTMDQYGPYVKAFGGAQCLILINRLGRLCALGKLHDDVFNGYMDMLSDEVVVDVQGADQYIIILTSTGRVYSFGQSSNRAGQLGYPASHVITTPKLVEGLSDIKQISAGYFHVAASTLPPLSRYYSPLCVPQAVPREYPDLSMVSCNAIHGRMLLLDHFSQSILQCWKLFHQYHSLEKPYHVNPLEQPRVRAVLSHTPTGRQLQGALLHSMNSRTVGPNITVRRLEQRNKPSPLPILTQIYTQILKKDPVDLRCSTRAWKVTLIGEGADDAGGVFDETMAEMCKELESNKLSLLIPTPNSRNKCGFNTDRYVFNPECCSQAQLAQLKFLGIMIGVAIRTKRPLDLHLASSMWKLLAGMVLSSDDLEEIDVVFTQTLHGIRDVHKGGISEADFSEMIPLESYEALSMTGEFVPVVHGGHSMPLTFNNRCDYVEKALYFRLHELDKQVAAVREGMSRIIPVPLLSLLTAGMLEVLVCGYEEIDVDMLKKVAKYKGGLKETSDVVQWLWQTLESFTNQQKVLFLRFVSGRSRLPTNARDIGQSFQISKSGNENSLPTSQTCFFQLRLPAYSTQEQLAEKLLYSIEQCRSIDMDNYMLHRTSSTHDDTDEGDTDDDDYESE